MPKSYYFLLKKSSQITLAVIFLILPFLFVSAAKAQAPNDPKYALQAPYLQQINAPGAWGYTTGTKSVVVAVTDTGVDIDHPDLENNIWTNTKEIPNNSVDDDRNGYVDDVYGWNFVEDNNDVTLSAIKQSDDSQAVVHGTVLAGLIGAVGNNGIDGTGVNWNVKIMPLRVMDSSGNGALISVAKAVDYAVANGAGIISLSIIGDVNDSVFEQSLKNAYKKGVLIVSAAGNDRLFGDGDLSKNKHYPICADSGDLDNWILGVTAVDLKDKLSDFADYGSCVDLSAPGEGIFSTELLSPANGYTKEFDGAWYGTSFSAPLAAGAAALVKSIRPDWDAKEIIADLLSTADDIDGLNPQFIGQLGYGRLNVGRAVAKAVVSRIIKPPLKWDVYSGGLIFVNLKKKKLTLETVDFKGNKQPLWSANGVTDVSAVRVGNYWKSGEQVLIKATQNKQLVQFVVDLESKSWMRDVE
ncbi:MAG: S8 family peptidase [Patescibacteria group bacterium]